MFNLLGGARSKLCPCRDRFPRRAVSTLVTMSKRYVFDEWERKAEAWYRDQGFSRTRAVEKLEPAGWAAFWAGCDIATQHPQIESLSKVARAHRRSGSWIEAGFAMAGRELTHFQGVLTQPELPLVIDLSVAEIRRGLRADREGYEVPNRELVEWALAPESLPDNPYVRLLEVVSLLGQWEKAHRLLRSTMDSWLTRMAWRQGVPIVDLAAATERPDQWVRHKIGGTPPPQPVVALDWWRGEKQRRSMIS